MTKKQKLELTWIGKDHRPKLEPRILLEDPSRSYHAPHRVTEQDSFDNRLIFGDNLLALKALEAEFTGKVKCVFIDPPYNTGSAFTHYDDGLEHSIWLSILEGFKYAPSDTLYWQQGYSTERSFIYVTTQNLSRDQLVQLSEEVGQDRSLLVLCLAFRADPDKFENLTIKKIPKHILDRCEWDHDDYSLKVENLPKAPPKPGQLELEF